MQAFFPVRTLKVLAIVLALSCSSGCIASRMEATTNRPIEDAMNVFVRSGIEQHRMDTAIIFKFTVPPETDSASDSITAAFQSRLVQRRPFRELKALPVTVKSDTEALWYVRNEGYDLAIVPYVIYLMDGTGALPTRLVLRTRIVDARTNQVLWDVKQSAFSEPGLDVDLFWNTLPGKPAQKAHALADDLAGRFADFLIQPTEKESDRL